MKPPTNATTPVFSRALPVWPAGMEREMNRFVGFRAQIPAPTSALTLRIAASTLYRAFVNGRFLGCGPARAAHGYFRVDEWVLPASDSPLDLRIEVAAYNCNSYYTLDQPAFLQAEVVDNTGQAVVATGGEDFEARLLDEHVQKVERYSVVRTFCEMYDLQKHSVPSKSLDCAAQPAGRLLPRRAPYPSFEIIEPRAIVANGGLLTIDGPVELKRDWTLTAIGRDFKGFREEELTIIPSLELQKLQSVFDSDQPASQTTQFALDESRYRILDFGRNRTGFIRIAFRCDAKTRLAIVFDEVLTGGDVSFNRLRCNNVIWIDAAPGAWSLQTFEPYTLRYAKLMTLQGACFVERVELVLYEHPHTGLPDPGPIHADLRTVYDAAVATFRQSCLDIPMDCPSRERAGWLCDSFYIARAEQALTGASVIERNFLENYVLPERFDHLPEGMVAMNYPADHYNGKFIPNWALWLILQLEDYLARTGDRGLIDAFAPRVDSLLRYFDRFRNADGLLEKLESWIFVEWSQANDFVQDVNYPTNMLYAGALDAAGRLYCRNELRRQATMLRSAVLDQSFDGEFFVDNAVRAAGVLRPTTNRTEVCQYHAFYFDLVSPTSHTKLWRRLLDRQIADLHPANALMGYTMRLELLDRYASSKQVCQELVRMYLPQAQLTGTLWEHSQPTESCCHGYASYAAALILKHGRAALESVSPAQ